MCPNPSDVPWSIIKEDPRWSLGSVVGTDTAVRTADWTCQMSFTQSRHFHTFRGSIWFSITDLGYIQLYGETTVALRQRRPETRFCATPLSIDTTTTKPPPESHSPSPTTPSFQLLSRELRVPSSENTQEPDASPFFTSRSKRSTCTDIPRKLKFVGRRTL